MTLDFPLMEDNIVEEDLDCLVRFLTSKPKPRLTQSGNVSGLEEEWSAWLGTKHSVFLNSGASANLLTIAALKYLHGEGGEIIVPPLTWVSDISSVILNGFTPVFVDINPRTLCMDESQVIDKLSSRTKAVFITYVQGFNGLSDRLLSELGRRKTPLLEDVCESHGATFKGRKLGSFGLASNFSYYFAHHMSTIEGGMVSTNDEDLFQTVRMLRSHGMTREMTSTVKKEAFAASHPDLNPDFIFAMPAFNARNTELGAVLGRSQLKRLDANNLRRTENLKVFLANIDPEKYRTDFDIEGSSNYAFNLVMKGKDFGLRDRIEKAMREASVEFRRGSAGGGNQLRQPYMRRLFPEIRPEDYPEVDHVHFFAWYIGNYPSLRREKILSLCSMLNKCK
jgi:CDP-6-deoxy-D-xylo-4-hexulose-3-dehydrase